MRARTSETMAMNDVILGNESSICNTLLGFFFFLCCIHFNVVIGRGTLGIIRGIFLSIFIFHILRFFSYSLDCLSRTKLRCANPGWRTGLYMYICFLTKSNHFSIELLLEKKTK